MNDAELAQAEAERRAGWASGLSDVAQEMREAAGAEWQPYGDQRSYPRSQNVSLIGQRNAGYTIIDQKGTYRADNQHDVVVLGWKRSGELAGYPGYVQPRYVTWRVFYNGDGPLYSSGDFKSSLAGAAESFARR